MASEFSVVRMASTAAWSAIFSSPRPLSLDAARAAASVTRTASSARLRSILPAALLALLLSWALTSSIGVSMRRLKRLYPDQAGLLGHRLQLGDARQRAPHRRLFRLMRRQHDRHLAGLRAPALQHRFERDALLGERAGYRRDHAWPILHHQAHIVSADMAIHRRGLLVGETRRRHDKGRHVAPARHVHKIGDDGRGGRPLPRTAALEHGGADEVAFDHDGVEHALDMGDRRSERHHAGMHPLLDAVSRLARQTQEFYAIAELLGKLDVHRGHMADAFDMDTGEI